VDSEVRDNPPTRELGTDRPGRFPTHSAQLSSVADTDWHGLFKTEAAALTAEKINKLASTKDLTHHTIPQIEKIINQA